MNGRIILAGMCLTCLSSHLNADSGTLKPSAKFNLPSVGGWVMTSDNVTLIVSVPSKGELIYFNTVTDKEVKRVEVDFQPTCLALQGESLYAGGKGSSIVYVLNAGNGKEIRQIKVPGEPIDQLGCHPSKGMIYASNTRLEVFSIDPKSGTVQKTSARGTYLAVDAVKGNFLYTGSNKSPKEQIVVQGVNDNRAVITFGLSDDRAKLLKYSISGDTLKLVEGCDNAAIGAGGAMHLSPDGQSIAFVAGGGWWSRTDPKHRVEIAVFDTESLNTMRGSVDVGAPQNIAFHPVLKLGVGLGNNVDLCFFNPKSLVIRSKVSLERMPHTFWFNLLTFGGKGAKLIYLQGENLLFIPLQLSTEERATLEARYRKASK